MKKEKIISIILSIIISIGAVAICVNFLING